VIRIEWQKGLGPQHLADRLERAPRKAILALARVFESGMNQIRGTINTGDFFDVGEGELQTSIWVGRPKRRGLNTVEVEGGWTRRYGPVLEFGSKLEGWWIRAKWATRLRFAVGIQGPLQRGATPLGSVIVYAKEVYHKYSDDQKRPHWAPSIEQEWPDIQKRIDLIPKECLQ
jgi:hypothetical protein